MERPNKYAAAKSLGEKILYLLSIMEKGAAPELAMEVAEMDGISSEEGLADLTLSIEQELEKLCHDGLLHQVKEHRQKVRYALHKPKNL